MSEHTVLVVDDNADIRDLLTEALEDAGHSVRTAANGREALTALEEGPVDLAIVDLMMPLMNGYELATILSERGLPFIVLSAYNVGSSAAEEMGAVDAFGKPVNLNELVGTVNLAMKRRRRPS